MTKWGDEGVKLVGCTHEVSEVLEGWVMKEWRSGGDDVEMQETCHVRREAWSGAAGKARTLPSSHRL